VLRDVYNADVNRIVVDSSGGLKRVKQHLTNWGGGRLPQGVLVDQHRERIPILDYFRVNAAIREALKPRVDLPSGGYIIIEKTEALTVIDVNSGSFTRSQTSRETVLWTNCEAATEIARQLRLRNIAGVIVVDFIDMDSRRDQQQVLEHFNRALQTDKAKPQIAQLTELGLVELTRKRQGKNIYELFGQTCSACAGLGSVARLPGESEHRQIEPGFERFPEARDSRRPELRREASAPAADELGPDADVDLELMHHPSYQERGARGARGGRRRRRGELAFAKEPVPTRSGPWEEEGRYGNGSARSTTVAAPTFAASADRASVEAPAAGFSQEPRELAREEREPRRSRRERPPAEPPELVHVEMSAAEQEVYAWMGISPLVLSTQEVKNPKNTLIAVTLPGEDVPPSLQAMANQPRPLSPRASRRGGVEPSLEDLEGAEAPVAEADPSPDSREPKAAPRRILTRRQRQAAPLDLPIAEVPLSEPPEPTSVAVAESDAEVDNELAPRRRRRRSSASR
jgi:ribonuclease E